MTSNEFVLTKRKLLSILAGPVGNIVYFSDVQINRSFCQSGIELGHNVRS